MPKPPPTSGAETRIFSRGQRENVVGELVADGVDAGGGEEEIERAVLPSADRASRFHRGDDETIVDEFDVHNVGWLRRKAAWTAVWSPFWKR